MTPKLDHQRLLAVWISNVTNPVLLVAISLVYLTNRYINDLDQVIQWSALGLSLIVVAPAVVYFIVNRHLARKVDIDISNRADRPLPLMLASLGALIGGYLVGARIDQNSSLLLLNNTLVAMLLLLTIISFVWKISIHASTLTALVTLIVIFRGFDYVPLYLLVIPVAWARLYLQQHTIAQLVGGSLMGAVVTYATAVLLDR